MKWRPEGWDIGGDDSRYERGADAMYEPAYGKGRKDEREALRKTGEPSYNDEGTRGTWVFIPDEETELEDRNEKARNRGDSDSGGLY